jgi:hypothetical protein
MAFQIQRPVFGGGRDRRHDRHPTGITSRCPPWIAAGSAHANAIRDGCSFFPNAAPPATPLPFAPRASAVNCAPQNRSTSLA